MASLSNLEIQKLFKDRPAKRYINAGVRHQDRLAYHTVTAVSKEDLSPYHHDYISWIANNRPELLPKDKVERFKQLITLPIPTNELTESIFSHLNSVFKGQDAFFRYDFTDPKKLADWKDYNDFTFWQTFGFEAMINAIDSVWVVNLPAEQTTEYPAPRDLLINIKDIIDISVDRNNVCEYVIFKANGKIFVYDDLFFRAYSVKDGDISKLPESEIPHNLGYCPARMFWSDMLLKSNYINKKAPLTNVLGDLDWLLTCQVFKKYMELGNSYPITVAIKQTNDYESNNNENNRGRSEEQRETLGGNLIGPGSFFEADPPLQDEYDPMANPVRLISPDVTNLKYHDESLKAKQDRIFYSVVGKDGEATKEAINEKQVEASFESQTTNLLKIAHNFELIQTFADKCKIDLRYGPDELKSISIDYGTKFFLKSANDIISDLDTAKKNGSHSSVIDVIMNKVIEAEYRNDKNGYTRAKIIQELDPLPDKTQDEAMAIYKEDGISKEQFIIKCQLLNFVRRFEREQRVSLTDFASARPYDEKIRNIYDEFILYANEIKGSEPTPPVVNEIRQPELIT